jgi:hypothetical protein
VEAAKLPEPWHLDRTRAVCLFRAVAALAACGSSLPLASLHNVLLCKAGPAGLRKAEAGEARCKGQATVLKVNDFLMICLSFIVIENRK